MQFEKEISKYYEIEPYSNLKDCWRTAMGEPGGDCVTIIFKILPAGDACIALIVIDGFDEKLCDAVFALLEKSDINANCSNNAILMIEGLDVEGYPFDSIAITNYESFRMFEAVDHDLDRRVCGIAPIAKCELTGNESADEILGIFAGLVQSTSWKRDIAPRTSMRYKLSTGTARKYKLYDQYSLSCALEELTEEDKYNIEINNFKEEYIKILMGNGYYIVIGKGEEMYLQAKSLSELKQWVRDYLIRGLD